MNVRGAPLIAIVAVLGLGCDISAQAAAGAFESLGKADQWLREAADYLRTSRPTAVNLFTAMDQVVALGAKVRRNRAFYSNRSIDRSIDPSTQFRSHPVRTLIPTGGFGAGRG
jgi:methylthioribose-1-phosphate isomerase